jgi:hypothetical protein
MSFYKLEELNQRGRRARFTPFIARERNLPHPEYF